MPEDGLVGFKFFDKDDGPSIANEAAQRNAVEHLSNTTAIDSALQHLGTAIGAVQEAAQKKADRGDDNRPDTNWEDNVPPDLTEGSDFLL